jgi:hypothetical protein
MFQLLIAVIAISSVATLVMAAIFYAGAAFTAKSPAMGSVARPLLISQSGKVSVGLQATLALLLVCIVALGFGTLQ